jgi:Protein of unknown function (DUF4239)
LRPKPGAYTAERAEIEGMNLAALSTPLLRLAGTLVAAGLAYGYLRSLGLYEFTVPEAGGIGTLMLLLGSIYAVMFAFVIFVIWDQFTDVENMAMRECGSLDDLLRFSQYLNADANHAIRRALVDYAQRVVNSEWPSLGDRRKDPQTEKAFTVLMHSVIRAVPASPSEEQIHARLIDIVRRAGEHRDDRIAKSLTQIPPTLVRLVNGMALALLLLVFVYPFHSGLIGFSCLILLAAVLFGANVVMMDMDNPFKGLHNVSPESFSDLTA